MLRVQGGFWKTLDKVCPCCAVASSKYAVGENKADPAAKLYEGVDNTLEPVRCSCPGVLCASVRPRVTPHEHSRSLRG